MSYSYSSLINKESIYCLSYFQKYLCLRMSVINVYCWQYRRVGHTSWAWAFWSGLRDFGVAVGGLVVGMAITFLKIWLLLWVCVHHGFRLAYLYLTRNDLQALRMPINYLVRMTYASFDSYEPSLKFADYLYLRHLFTCGVFPLTWNDFYSRCFFLSKLVGNSFA